MKAQLLVEATQKAAIQAYHSAILAIISAPYADTQVKVTALEALRIGLAGSSVSVLNCNFQTGKKDA